MKRYVRFLGSLVVVLSFVAGALCQEKIDLETISRIRYEGFRDSKVMELASGLMDSIGERLTGSPNMKRANEWTRDQLTAMGLSNAHLEPVRSWMGKSIHQRPDDFSRYRSSPGLRQSVDAWDKWSGKRQMRPGYY